MFKKMIAEILTIINQWSMKFSCLLLNNFLNRIIYYQIHFNFQPVFSCLLWIPCNPGLEVRIEFCYIRQTKAKRLLHCTLYKYKRKFVCIYLRKNVFLLIIFCYPACWDVSLDCMSDLVLFHSLCLIAWVSKVYSVGCSKYRNASRKSEFSLLLRDGAELVGLLLLLLLHVHLLVLDPQLGQLLQGLGARLWVVHSCTTFLGWCWQMIDTEVQVWMDGWIWFGL